MLLDQSVCLPRTVLVCNAADFVWHAIVHWSLRQCRIFNVISRGVIYLVTVQYNSFLRDLGGRWWGLNSRNCGMWPNFFFMNVFFAL